MEQFKLNMKNNQIFLLVIFVNNSFYFHAQNFYRDNRRLMRRKSDFTSALDEMFCEDDKKRISAIKLIREIAATIGPARVRNELVPFLNQFLDDDPSIMVVLLDQLDNFSPLIGGTEHDKILLPLLINFCLLDQKEVALKSLKIIEQILNKNSDAYLDTVKKLSKADMSVSKQCAIILIVNGIKKVPHLEATFLETYKGIVFSENPSFRIIAARYFRNLVENSVNKDEICKIIDIFYNDAEDLPKLLTIDSLLLIYAFNPSVVMNKLKMLVCIGTWRINIRLCQYSNQFNKILSKLHFKTLMEPCYLKMMSSEDNQIRAASCYALVSVARSMSVEENSSKLYPIIMKLSQDKVDYVKNEFAKNLVKVFPYFSQDKIKDNLIPLVIKFLKQSNLEVSSGILEDFKQLSKYLKNEKFEQNILKPLASQLAAENWRLKIQTLDILGKVVVEQDIYSDFIVDILLKEMKNKIEAVRVKATTVIINVIKKSPKQWSQSQLLPQVMKAKEEPNYLLRQRVLAIIEETSDSVSSVWLTNYKKIIGQMLADKIPNIRMLALRCILTNKKLLDKGSQVLITKLKQDSDMQIKQAAKQIKI